MKPPSSLRAGPLPPDTTSFGHVFDQRRVRTLTDWCTRSIITAGGIGIIVCILGMCVFLVKEVIPLFRQPEATLKAPIPLAPLQEASSSPALVGIGEHRELAYVLRGAVLEFIRLGHTDSQESTVHPHTVFHDGVVTASTRALGKGQHLALGTEDGRVIPVTIEFDQEFNDGERSISPRVTAGTPITAAPTPLAIKNMAYQSAESAVRIAALLQDEHLWLTTRAQRLTPDGGEEASITQVDLTSHIQGRVTALSFGGVAETLAVGTEEGKLYHFDIREADQPVLAGNGLSADTGEAVTALAYLMGDQALVVGGALGQVAVWMPVREHPHSNMTEMREVHRFSPHASAITGITISQRDKGFVTSDATGEMRVHHSTSEQTLLHLDPGQGASRSMYFAPKADGIIGLTDTDHLIHYDIWNPHPEVTWRTLFLPVWYESYDRPELVWQSSGGSDDFEPKFSLTPLIFGTVKGTLYAMLLAVPLAVLAAIYTAMFMHPDLRAKLKPTIEVMAALPTVVLGFLAGLWFAPVLERYFPAMTALTMVIPLAVVGSAALYLMLPVSIRHRVRPGGEALLMMPVIIGVVWWCLANNGWWETVLFDGRYKVWLEAHLGLRYDQRNAIVVGLAMGFAIIPIIYSISEDALSNVPKNLIAGSLALGATRWQTLVRLVLISASPGIFSALMIGLGRAVGETMIVLMATGNTPIMDWSLFNGFRTLSANIAVEVPEAPHGGTLYRTLFLAGLLLFIVTFVINAVAELIRQRLRAKYSQF